MALAAGTAKVEQDPDSVVWLRIGGVSSVGFEDEALREVREVDRLLGIAVVSSNDAPKREDPDGFGGVIVKVEAVVFARVRKLSIGVGECGALSRRGVVWY